MTADPSDIYRHAVELEARGREIVQKASVVVTKVTLDTERDAKVLAPVDTGFLRNSISSTVRGLVGEVGPSAEYGAYVEDGTSRMAPQPYMGPATAKNAVAFYKAMEKL